MNILQVVPQLDSGGVETGTVDMAKELIKQGHKAVVISNGGRLLKDLLASGAVHYTLPVHKKSPLAIISMIKKIRQVIEKEDIDIVHARSRAPAIPAFFAAFLAKVPFITTCHGYYRAHIFSRVMSWGKFVIVSSNVIARHMIKDFGVPLERIRLVPRGVDIEKFPYRPPDEDAAKKEYTIGIIGRITPIKGHVYLIRATSRVARVMPNIRLLVIGDAPSSKPQYRQELEALVKRLALSKYIHFLGDRRDISQVMARLDLLVMPSVGEEAFGRVILEAQASGIPVIASRVGGIIDIIKDGENGILIPPRDWAGLSEAIVKVLKDNELRQRFSKAGRSNVEKNFTLSHMYEKTFKVYSEALDSFKILIIKWSALGDIILSIPSLEAVKERFPKAEIIMLTSNAGRELLSRYPYIKEFIIFKRRRGIDGIKEMLEVSSELRRAAVDVALDLQNNKKSHATSFLSAIPRRIGYKSGKLDFFMNEAISGARMAISPVEHQFRLLKFLGIDAAPSKIELTMTDKERDFADTVLTEGWVGKGEVLVGINCGSSQRWQTKRWPVERLAKLCDLLAQKEIRVVITGSREDIPRAKRLLSLVKSKPINAVGKTTLMQLAAVIQKCRAFVSSDSAPVHIAGFLGVPFVALFGPTDPKRHIQPSAKYRIIYKGVECSPCYKPFCRNPRCMQDITAEEVAAAAQGLLRSERDR